MGSVTSKLGESGSNPWKNMDLTGVAQVRVLGTIHKCQHLRHEKILDGYDNSNTYIVVG